MITRLRATVGIPAATPSDDCDQAGRSRAQSLPAYLVIEFQDGATYLFRYNHCDVCVADTWHLTIAEAKVQAEFEYGILDIDWKDM